jgi:hypothetical protein
MPALARQTAGQHGQLVARRASAFSSGGTWRHLRHLVALAEHGGARNRAISNCFRSRRAAGQRIQHFLRGLQLRAQRALRMAVVTTLALSAR